MMLLHSAGGRGYVFELFLPDLSRLAVIHPANYDWWGRLGFDSITHYSDLDLRSLV